MWYDKPDAYNGEPEIKWFEDLETVFDDTRVLSGRPGEGIAMARRKGDTWWAAALANNDGGRQTIDLSFLEPGKKYEATIYTDGGEKVKTRTHVAVDTKKVKNTDKLAFELAPRGGVAIKFRPL